MKDTFKVIFGTALVTAVLMYLSFVSQRENVARQETDKIGRKISNQKHDERMARIWDKQPSPQELQIQQMELEDLKKAAAAAKKKSEALTAKSDQILSDFTDAASETNDEFRNEAKSRADAKKAAKSKDKPVKQNVSTAP